MNTRITRVGNSGAVDLVEIADIHGVQESQVTPKSRLDLKPAEAAISLPHSTELPNAVSPLTDILGARLTIDNPAWSGDPVPGMRLLQKTLLSHALQLQHGDRGDLLSAIELVEKAVQMRLRWQQMRRSESEAPPEPSPEKEPSCDEN